MSVRVIAYDTQGNPYYGQYVNIGIDVDRYLLGNCETIFKSEIKKKNLAFELFNY
jgi:hypothetical protein